MKIRRLLVGSIMVLVLSGCGRPEQPPRGKHVTVQFRRDALGGGGALPIPPTTDIQNGAAVSLKGKLLKINDEWLVLEYDKQKHWIPRDAVLMIRVEK